MHVVIFSGGSFSMSLLARKAIEKADLIIAADSGANTALRQGIIPKVVLGDFDSIYETTEIALQKKGVKFLGYSKDKDETDTELAVKYAIKTHATQITVLGGLMGNRFDHVIGTLLLSEAYTVPIRYFANNQIVWIENGPKKVAIRGRKGDLLSLIPLSKKIWEITTKNLQYPLKHERLYLGKSRGLSNVLTDNTAQVFFSRGKLIFIHTRKGL